MNQLAFLLILTLRYASQRACHVWKRMVDNIAFIAITLH